MGYNIIDHYNYSLKKCEEKKAFYEDYQYTEEEKRKANHLHERIVEFIKAVGDEEELKNPFNHIELYIKYRSDIGYISSVNVDRDIVDIYYYGNKEEESFYNAIIDYEAYMQQSFEFLHREELKKDYCRRFLNGIVSEDDYHGPFFFAELALQDLRKCYGDNIPQYFIDYYEDYIKSIEGIEYKYDFNSNSLIIEKPKRIVLV